MTFLDVERIAYYHHHLLLGSMHNNDEESTHEKTHDMENAHIILYVKDTYSNFDYCCKVLLTEVL
mgnify:CR=1 FL=1